MNRRTLSNIYGLQFFKISTLNTLFTNFTSKKKTTHWKGQNMKHILVSDSLLNNRIKAIADYGFRQYKLSKPKETLPERGKYCS